jgi:hypothetical protein
MTGQYLQVADGAYSQPEPDQVDEVLLAGAAHDPCLHLGKPAGCPQGGALSGRPAFSPVQRFDISARRVCFPPFS